MPAPWNLTERLDPEQTFAHLTSTYVIPLCVRCSNVVCLLSKGMYQMCRYIQGRERADLTRIDTLAAQAKSPTEPEDEMHESAISTQAKLDQLAARITRGEEDGPSASATQQGTWEAVGPCAELDRWERDRIRRTAIFDKHFPLD